MQETDLDDLFEGLDLEELSAEEELLQRIAEEKHVVSRGNVQTIRIYICVDQQPANQMGVLSSSS